MNKKGAVVTGIVVIILIVIIAIWIFDVVERECRKDSDCGEDSYCTSDFTCHKIPVIERTPKVYDFTFLGISFIILGVAIIIAALVYKRKKNSKEVKIETEEYLPLRNEFTQVPKSRTKKTFIFGIILGTVMAAIIMIIILLIAL